MISSALLALSSASADAVIFVSTGDPTFNTTAPSGEYAGSGWQYQGLWMDFTGTPIAPRYFITAKHVSGEVGTPIVYQDVSYTTDGFTDVPGTDLRIWHVTADFSDYAPLFANTDETGHEFVVFGRGTQRGAEQPEHGWLWGSLDGTLRWGTNSVSLTTPTLLGATFDIGTGNVNEATLSLADSGGGIFIKDTDGVWKLAGINLGVSGRYKTSSSPGETPFNASLYDQSGYFEEQEDGSFTAAAGPGQLYATRISTNLDFIQNVTGVPEPASAALCIFGALQFGFVRRRRERPRRA